MVNLPLGKIVEKDVDVEKVKYKEMLVRLMDQKFAGYVVVTIRGKSGIDEAVLVYDEGKIIGGAYEYLSYGKLLIGEDALQRIFNAFAAKIGYMDIVALDKDKMQLVLAFNSKIIFNTPITKKTVEKYLKTTFENKFEEEDIKEKKEDKESVLRKYNLNQVK